MKSSSSNKLQKLFAGTDRKKKKKPDSLLKKAARAYLMHLLQSPQEQPSRIAGSILNTNFDFETLNFKDIQDTIRRPLTDDDIHRLLLAVNGVNKIKSLQLTHCNITGAGLAPLHGSTVLEKIDLGSSALLSEGEVVPILSSILDMEDNSLSYVNLPFKWRKDWSDALSSFLERFNNSLRIRNDQHERDDDFFCVLCKKWYFEGCIEVLRCGRCEKETCEGCGDYCEKCESIFCWSCELSGGCDHCEKELCSHCSLKCESCSKFSCEACNDEHGEGIEVCDFECGGLEGGGCGNGERDGVSRCLDCRVKRVERRGDSSCPGCAQIIAPLLVKKVNKLQRRNKKLKRRIEQMQG